MVLLESIKLELGKAMPAFSLSNPNNKTYTSDQLMGSQGLLIKFTCNHCPYALAVWDRFITLASYAKTLGINTVTINPNIHPDYPADSPENMIKFIDKYQLPFPYLVDDTQNIAEAYQAQCTPDIYLLTSDMTLYYHGRIDDNWKDESKVTQFELRNALNDFIHNKAFPSPQYPSMGCSIKWLH